MQKDRAEHELIQQIIKGDAIAFDSVFKRYNVKVFVFSYRNLKNKQDAEGVVQEVFLSLWEQRAKLKEVRSLDAWIFGISFNIVHKCFRKLASEREHLKKFLEVQIQADNSTVTELEYNDLLEESEKVIEKLPNRQKAVYLLSKKDGLSNAEISSRLNISIKTVENYLTGAKAYLKSNLLNQHLVSALFFWLFIG